MPKLQIFKSARGILMASIRDIVAGQWCKSNLAEIDEDVWAEHYDLFSRHSTYETAVAEKPIGCALGLCAMHGGDGSESIVHNSRQFTLVHVSTPDSDSSPEVKQAVRALFYAIPAHPSGNRRSRERVARLALSSGNSFSNLDRDDEEMVMEEITTEIARYNDKGKMTAQMAAEWFTNALQFTSLEVQDRLLRKDMEKVRTVRAVKI